MKPNIFIIDRDHEVRLQLAKHLCGQYRCLTATDLNEGLRIIREETVDIIIAEYLDDKSSYQMLEATASRSEPAAVIFLLPAGVEGRAPMLVSGGAFDWMPKPIKPDWMFLQAGRALEYQRSLRENFNLRASLNACPAHLLSAGAPCR